MDTDNQKRLEAEQISDIYGKSVFATIVSIILTTVLSLYLWGHISNTRILAWYSANGLTIALHYAFYLGFRKAGTAEVDVARWGRIITLVFTVRAMAFGSAGILLFSHEANAQSALIMVIAGMVGGVVGYYHTMKHIAITFCIVFLAPLAYSFFACQSGSHAVLGVFTLIYMASMVIATLSLNRKYTEGVMLRFKTESLTSEWVSTFDSVQDVIFVLDREHRIIRANKYAFEKLGKTEEELLGSHCHELMHCSDSPLEGCPHAQLLKDGKHHVYEFFDESLCRYFQVNVYPTHDNAGELSGSVHVLRDITESRKADAALKESEEKYRILVNASPLGIHICDLEGRITLSNPAHHEIMQAPGGSLVGTYLWDLLVDDADKKQLRESFSYLVKELPAPVTVYNTNRTLAGNLIDVKVDWEYIRDASGSVTGFLSIVEDITEKKRAAEELAYSQGFLKSIIDNEPECVKLLEADGTLIDMNPSGLAMIEADGIEQVRGKIIIEVVAPEHREAFASLTRRVCQGEAGTLEFRLIGLKGAERWLETHAVPFYDEKRKETLLLAVTRDITEKKKTNDRLKLILKEKDELINRLDMLHRAIEATQVGVSICDNERNIIYVNEAEARMHGYSVGEMLGRKTSIYTGKDAPSPTKLEDLTLKDGWVRESTNACKDGSEIPVLLSSVFMKDDEGRPGAMVTICEDIAGIKENEARLRDALNQREVLIKEIHHRVKNNLSIIQSLLSLQSSQSEDASAKTALDESKGRVVAMALIHERLYKSSDLSTMDFADYMSSLASSLYDNYCTNKKDIEIRVHIPRVSIDVDTIIPCGLIVNELLTNAFKYAFPPGKKGEVFVGVESDEAGLMHMVVRDNGVGLPAGLNIDKTRSLGMKIVRSLSRQIGSEVEIASSDSGTEFRILLLRQKLQPMEWVESVHLSGHELIDKQHKQLYEAIEALKLAIESGRHEEGLREIIPSLLDYVDEHFRTEEEIMSRHGYPEIEAHRAIHRDFEEKASSMVKEIDEGGKHLSLAVHDFLAHWFMSHVGGPDRELGAFMRSKGLAQEPALAGKGHKAGILNILFIEDDRLAQLAMDRFLQKQGYTYKTVSSGGEAIEAAMSRSFDLVISDFVLPDMNGIEALEKLRETGVKAPVLFLTGQDVEETRGKTPGLNALGVLPKPVSFPDLKKMLDMFFAE